MKKAKALYLATDPDREGEAISWHVIELLRAAKALDGKPVHRVVFHEITARAVDEAMASPREVSTSLVNAQQARRALDYLVGFNLSPLLWKKIRKGLSAGRVQSPALRMIVEREEEIERIREARVLDHRGRPGERRDGVHGEAGATIEGEKLEQFSITDEASARPEREQPAGRIELDARAAPARTGRGGRRSGCCRRPVRAQRGEEAAEAQPGGAVHHLDPAAGGGPEARILGHSRTMRVAQQLYEGVDTGDGAVGLITYMRTDSTTLASDAVAEIRAYIARVFGGGDVPPSPGCSRPSARNAQEAHEAIRPTSVDRGPPRSLAGVLSARSGQALRADLEAHRRLPDAARDHRHRCGRSDLRRRPAARFPRPRRDLFRATGSTVAVPGFLAVYEEGVTTRRRRRSGACRRSRGEDAVESSRRMRSGAALHRAAAPLHGGEPDQALEDRGIGRPSTYAAIISTLQQREYAELESRRFHPTDVGRLVNAFVTEHFADYVDYDFTARLEDDLDAVSRGEREWVPLLDAVLETELHRTVEEKERPVSPGPRRRRPGRWGSIPHRASPGHRCRVGRYGPYAQIGSADEAEKPKFAEPERRAAGMGTITLEEALMLFDLPREHMEQTPEGEPPPGEHRSLRSVREVRLEVRVAGAGGRPVHHRALERALSRSWPRRSAPTPNAIDQEFEGGKIRILKGRYGPTSPTARRTCGCRRDGTFGPDRAR